MEIQLGSLQPLQDTTQHVATSKLTHDHANMILLFMDCKILNCNCLCHLMLFSPHYPYSFFSFHPLCLSPLDFIYAHASFQLYDGFSAAMLNFTGLPISLCWGPRFPLNQVQDSGARPSEQEALRG